MFIFPEFPLGLGVLKALLETSVLSSHPDDSIYSGNSEKLSRRGLPVGMHSLYHLGSWLSTHSAPGCSLGLNS